MLVAGASAAARAQASPKPAAELASTLDQLVPQLLKDGDVPGLSMAIVKNGAVSWHHSWGVKDASTGAPVDDETIFEAASLSKPVFAYAVMKLVDAGVIDLDTPIAHYLPGDYVRDPRGAQITPRNALSHTTGFPNWRNDEELKLYTAPGERFSYSGEGVVYLAKAVENVTGKTLNVVMKEQVFVPLGMTSSSYTWQERFEKRKAMGHDAERIAGAPQAAAGGQRGGEPADDGPRLRALSRGGAGREGAHEEDVDGDAAPADLRGRGVPELRLEQAVGKALEGDCLGPRLGNPVDGRRQVDLALGRQRRLPRVRPRRIRRDARASSSSRTARAGTASFRTSWPLRSAALSPRSR